MANYKAKPGVVGGDEMELASGQRTLLEEHLGHFASLIGDRRTGRAVRAIVQGILGAESWEPRAGRRELGVRADRGLFPLSCRQGVAMASNGCGGW